MRAYEAGTNLAQTEFFDKVANRPGSSTPQRGSVGTGTEMPGATSQKKTPPSSPPLLKSKKLPIPEQKPSPKEPTSSNPPAPSRRRRGSAFLDDIMSRTSRMGKTLQKGYRDYIQPTADVAANYLKENVGKPVSRNYNNFLQSFLEPEQRKFIAEPSESPMKPPVKQTTEQVYENMDFDPATGGPAFKPPVKQTTEQVYENMDFDPATGGPAFKSEPAPAPATTPAPAPATTPAPVVAPAPAPTEEEELRREQEAAADNRFNVQSGGYGRQLRRFRDQFGKVEANRDLLEGLNYKDFAEVLGNRGLRVGDQLDARDILRRLREGAQGPVDTRGQEDIRIRDIRGRDANRNLLGARRATEPVQEPVNIPQEPVDEQELLSSLENDSMSREMRQNQEEAVTRNNQRNRSNALLRALVNDTSGTGDIDASNPETFGYVEPIYDARADRDSILDSRRPLEDKYLRDNGFQNFTPEEKQEFDRLSKLLNTADRNLRLR